MKKDCFYRISVKALIENEEGKFLLLREKNDMWELPGGGLDHGEEAHVGLAREIQEEMGVPVQSIEQAPSFFTTTLHRKGEYWIANVIYRVQLQHFNITVSDECLEYRFFDKNDTAHVTLFPNVQAFVDQLP